MLTTSRRLRKNEDIRAVLRAGRRVQTPVCTAYIQSTTNESPARVATIVGRKVDTSAVRRHKIQRWLREIARTCIDTRANGYDMVLVAKSPATHVNRLADMRTACAPIMRSLAQLS